MERPKRDKAATDVHQCKPHGSERFQGLLTELHPKDLPGQKRAHDSSLACSMHQPQTRRGEGEDFASVATSGADNEGQRARLPDESQSTPCHSMRCVVRALTCGQIRPASQAQGSTSSRGMPDYCGMPYCRARPTHENAAQLRRPNTSASHLERCASLCAQQVWARIGAPLMVHRAAGGPNRQVARPKIAYVLRSLL